MIKSLTGSSVTVLFLMFAAVGGPLLSRGLTEEPIERAALHSPVSSIFGTRQKNQTEVFAASDVPAKVSQGVKETLAVAVDAWGSSGRMEYWVLGTDRDAAVELA